MGSRFTKHLAITVCVALLAACGGGGPDGAPSPADKYKSPTAVDSGGDGGSSGGSSEGVVRIGHGTGASFTQGQLGATQTALSAGDSTMITVNLVDGNHVAVSEEFTVRFSSSCYASGLASFDETSVATVAGMATTGYTAEGCSGTEEVTARVDVDGATLEAKVELSIEADEVLSVQYEGAASTQLSLAGMGGNETTRVSFKLVGAQGAPIRNESVTFRLDSDVGGVRLAEGKETGVSNNAGVVTTVLQSGTVSTTVIVTATHDATGFEGMSDSISISTGVPVNSHFSVSLSEYNPAFAHRTDGVEVDVSVISSDQYGNPALNGTQISFWSPESGSVGSSCTLVDGRCSVTWISADPRPADGRLTLIAYTNGAEDFVDTNGNNVYDTNDAGWVDVGEPCIDEDENGGCDPLNAGEFFVDENQNGILDSGDDVWNGPCLSGVNSAALCPGKRSVMISRTRTIILSEHTARIHSLGTFPDGVIDLTSGPKTLQGLMLADTNEEAIALGGNPLPAGASVKFETSNGEIVNKAEWTVPNANGPTGGYTVMLVPDEQSSTGTLKLTVEAPGTTTEFFWTVID